MDIICVYFWMIWQSVNHFDHIWAYLWRELTDGFLNFTTFFHTCRFTSSLHHYLLLKIATKRGGNVRRLAAAICPFLEGLQPPHSDPATHTACTEVKIGEDRCINNTCTVTITIGKGRQHCLLQNSGIIMEGGTCKSTGHCISHVEKHTKTTPEMPF